MKILERVFMKEPEGFKIHEVNLTDIPQRCQGFARRVSKYSAVFQSLSEAQEAISLEFKDYRKARAVMAALKNIAKGIDPLIKIVMRDNRVFLIKPGLDFDDSIQTSRGSAILKELAGRKTQR